MKVHLVALSGFLTTEAVPLSFDLGFLFDLISVKAPKVYSIKAINDEEELISIEVLSRGAINFKSLQIVFIPPWCL